MVYICQSNIPNLFNICVNFVNKQVYYELKNLADCPMVNKMFLNADKTELVFFISPKKQLDKELKIKRHGNGSTKLIQLNI